MVSLSWTMHGPQLTFPPQPPSLQSTWLRKLSLSWMPQARWLPSAILESTTTKSRCTSSLRHRALRPANAKRSGWRNSRLHKRRSFRAMIGRPIRIMVSDTATQLQRAHTALPVIECTSLQQPLLLAALCSLVAHSSAPSLFAFVCAFQQLALHSVLQALVLLLLASAEDSAGRRDRRNSGLDRHRDRQDDTKSRATCAALALHVVIHRYCSIHTA